MNTRPFIWLAAGAALLGAGVVRARAEDASPAAAAQPDLAELSPEQLTDLKVSTVYGGSRHWQEVAQAPSRTAAVFA